MSINNQINTSNTAFYPLRVKNVIAETDQAKSFVLEPESDVKRYFQYTPGQFLTFRIPLKNGEIERCYSISSAPNCDPDLRICVKSVDHGPGSNWFNEHLAVGATLMSRPPSGRFVLSKENSNLLIIAGGSGITPCISIIKHALAKTSRKIKLIYANQNRNSVIYLGELTQLEQQYTHRFECIHWLDEENGFMKVKHIVSLSSGHKNDHCYICGPAALMDLAEETLTSRFGDKAWIRTERFNSPPPISQTDDNSQHGEPPFQPSPVEFQLQLDGVIHSVTLEGGQTLLQAALTAGLDVPHSCTEGHCGTCMAQLCQGKVSMASTRALSKRNIERGNILLCQARPSTDKAISVNMDF